MAITYNEIYQLYAGNVRVCIGVSRCVAVCLCVCICVFSVRLALPGSLFVCLSIQHYSNIYIQSLYYIYALIHLARHDKCMSATLLVQINLSSYCRYDADVFGNCFAISGICRYVHCCAIYFSYKRLKTRTNIYSSTFSNNGH